jgi:hypothetical protein
MTRRRCADETRRPRCPNAAETVAHHTSPTADASAMNTGNNTTTKR